MNEKIFAARFYAKPEGGQIGPQQHGFIYREKSLAAAKRLAKTTAGYQSWRLVEVWQITAEDVQKFLTCGGGWQEAAT